MVSVIERNRTLRETEMDSLNFLTLHRDNARHELFSNQKTRDPFFDPRTKAWIVTNPSDCRLLISSEKLPARYLC